MIYMVLLITMCVGVSLFGADSYVSIQDSSDVNEFLQKYEENLPIGYKLIAAAKTLHAHHETFVLVSREQKQLGDLQVEIGSLNNLVASNRVDYAISAAALDDKYLGLTIDANLVFRRFYFRYFGETIKYLRIEKRPDLKVGVLDDREWGMEDIENKNPAIPKEAWLEILK